MCFTPHTIDDSHHELCHESAGESPSADHSCPVWMMRAWRNGWRKTWHHGSVIQRTIRLDASLRMMYNTGSVTRKSQAGCTGICLGICLGPRIKILSKFYWWPWGQMEPAKRTPLQKELRNPPGKTTWVLSSQPPGHALAWDGSQMAGGTSTHTIYLAIQKRGKRPLNGHWIWMRLISHDIGGSLASMFGHDTPFWSCLGTCLCSTQNWTACSHGREAEKMVATCRNGATQDNSMQFMWQLMRQVMMQLTRQLII